MTVLYLVLPLALVFASVAVAAFIWTVRSGQLDAEETREYKARLAALVAQGDDQPLDRLPPEALAALQHLRLLPPETEEFSTRDPRVSQALRAFRQRVGKAEPDDPAHADRLLPAERVALALYDQRLTRYGSCHKCFSCSWRTG